MLIFTFLSTLVKYMLVHLLWLILRPVFCLHWLTFSHSLMQLNKRLNVVSKFMEHMLPINLVNQGLFYALMKFSLIIAVWKRFPGGDV